MCDACDAMVHAANGIASKHERRPVRGVERDVDSADSRRLSKLTRGEVDVDVTTDDVIGMCDEYLHSALMPSSSFPVDTLDGAFWDETIGELDDETEQFLRDEPFGGDVHDGIGTSSPRGGATLIRGVVKPNSSDSHSGEFSGGSDGRSQKSDISRSDMERLRRIGREDFDSSFLGPILDDSAVKFLEANPTYGVFGSPSPESRGIGAKALAAKFGSTSVRFERDDGLMNGVGPKEETDDASKPATRFDAPPSGSDTYSGMPQPQTRLERLKRWKEKRKNRNFNKVIRYQSRKACADSRPRVKGKFVRVSSVPDLSKIREEGIDSEDEDEKDVGRDKIKELGLDMGMRAPPSMRAIKTGLVGSASMPDFSVYNMDD